MRRYIFEKEKIEALIKDFYISTGIAIVLYGKDTEVIAGSGTYTAYCARIRERPECQRRCTESNLLHIKEAERTGKTVHYMCHAGNMEVITPVLYENTVIAYLQIGQFRDLGGVYSKEEYPLRVAEEQGFDSDELRALYEMTPSVSRAKLAALENILRVVVKSFWEDGLIRCNRSMMSVRIEEYISRRISEPIRIQELCSEFSLSRNALYKIFRDEFGTSVGEYILDRRMERAQELLGKTRNAVSRIAAAVGFADYNYFIRIFKKRVGKTPLQYRSTQG